MPHLTQSPLSSPSLRSFVSTHGGQIKTSYFPPVPLAPHSYHGRVPPTPHSSLNVIHHSPQPNLNSNLVGCLKHSQHISNRPQSSQKHQQDVGRYVDGPYHRGDSTEEYIKPARKSINTIEKRRVSQPFNQNIKVSQIPIGSTTKRGIHTSINQQAQIRDMNTIPSHVAEGNHGRRRPSFKIELPSRPIQQSQHLTPLTSSAPFAGITHQPTTFTSPTVFRDPFVNSNTYEYPAGGYMILRAPTKVVGNSFMDDFPSPTQQIPSTSTPGLGLGTGIEVESMYGNQGIGLGYSLNKRVATPWLRSKADEEEWLKVDDLNDLMDVENQVRGLGIA